VTAALSIEDAEAIERATLAAVAPLEIVEDDDWLLCANEGAIGRANSVTALRAGKDSIAAKIDRALAFYAERGLEPKFRLSPWSQPAGLVDALSEVGFRPEQPTVVMVMDADALADNPDETGAELIPSPDPGWRALFLGAGVSADEAERRTSALARGQTMRFAQARVGDEIAAIGAVSRSGSWASIHGMRTAQPHRRRGHARRIVCTLAAAAASDGAGRIFLQVEADNAAAISLYSGLGFEEAYRYAYWRPSR
jgi:GNAT superfamily N-acetyltransferase